MNEEELHCKHFVVRKKRFCRMTVKKGEEYCGEHQINSCEPVDSKNLDKSKQRVICPLDNKHTCYANKLKKHLKICNARQKDEPPYVKKGVNGVQRDAAKTQRLLSNVSVIQIKETINKIKKIYSDLVQEKIEEKIVKHPVVEEETAKPKYGDKTKKHLKQASSILGLLKENDLLCKNSCFVEFGAGKGQLSFWISKACEGLENCSVLLVERSSQRHKKDNKLDKSEHKSHRLRIDIADLLLEEVDLIKGYENVVGVTKHLCGDATDLALRCLINYENSKRNISGIVMAFCCHHRCVWSTYVGKEFFNIVGLTQQDFDTMCGMVSWATCGSGVGRNMRNEMGPEAEKRLKLNDRDRELEMTREEKVQIGSYCKYILNWGRLRYLESNNFKCNLYYYIDLNTSPENLCIVAIKNIKY